MSTLALITVLALAAALAIAGLTGVRAAAGAGSVRQVDAVVTECPRALLGPGCTVTYDGPMGAVFATLDRPGLLAPGVGDHERVWVGADGTLWPAGPRPWIESALMFVLAGFVGASAVGWLRRLLRAGDEISSPDLRVTDEGDERREGGQRAAG